MKNYIKLSTVLLALFSSNLAAAEEKSSTVDRVKDNTAQYVARGLTSGRATSNDCEDITYGIMAKIGYDFSEYLGVEARGFQTNWDYEGGKLKHLGAFLKPMYPINEEITLYGLAGYAKTSMGTKRSFSDTGLAYGVGIDYALNEDFGLFVDYERLLHDAGVYDLDALSFGLSYGFQQSIVNYPTPKEHWASCFIMS